MTDPNVHVGDKVRVTYVYEGVISKITSSGEMWIRDKEVGAVLLSPAAQSVEVLERVVPKVGDVVKGTELDQLPEFSVVVAVGSTCVQQKTPGGKWWRAGISGTEIVYPTLDYRVLYIPEDGAE